MTDALFSRRTNWRATILTWRKSSGVKPMPGFTGPKLKWIARNEPDDRRLVNALLSPKDYLRLKLSGERASDMSDAAGTWLLDEARRDWSPEAFDACDADLAWAPPLFEGSAPAGRIRPEAADALGLPRGVLLAAGGGDAAVGAVGLGAIAPGEAFISLGTATQLIVATDRYMSAPESSCMLSPTRCQTAGTRWRRCSTAPARSLSPGGFSARPRTRSSARRRRTIRAPARFSFCPISAASARRSTILTRAAFCSA